jgi:hypothetical protein
MWTGYKLIVELEEDSFWFWQAAKDMHGTTMNSIAARHKRSHESYFRDKSAKDRAQWTRAMTLPRAVVHASQRK